jgi:hypothetical protein
MKAQPQGFLLSGALLVPDRDPLGQFASQGHRGTCRQGMDQTTVPAFLILHDVGQKNKRFDIMVHVFDSAVVFQ